MQGSLQVHPDAKLTTAEIAGNSVEKVSGNNSELINEKNIEIYHVPPTFVRPVP